MTHASPLELAAAGIGGMIVGLLILALLLSLVKPWR